MSALRKISCLIGTEAEEILSGSSLPKSRSRPSCLDYEMLKHWNTKIKKLCKKTQGKKDNKNTIILHLRGGWQ